MKKIRLSIFTLFVVSASLILMLLVFKGDSDIFYYQNTYDTKVGGPFELTNSTSRYALIEAFVENRSVFFTESQAKRSAPDISYHNGKYFSIFTPGISLLSIPLYILGKALGYQQHVTFLLNIIVQVINILLIAKLSTRFNVSFKKGLLSGLIFAFATNALTYSLTLAQHNVTAMFTLLAVLNALNKQRAFKNNFILGTIYGIAGLADIPNFFILLPSMLYAFYNSLITKENKIQIKGVIYVFIMGLAFLPFAVGFGLYNKAQTNSYFDNGQFIGRSNYPAKELTQTPEEKEAESREPKARHTPLYTRDQMRNLYLLTISNERGILFYSPIVLVGLLGLFLAYFDKRYTSIVSLITATVLITLALYSMHGDPWGGWAFSSRYMIVPASLILACTGVAFNRFKKKVFFHLIFILLLGYSLYVSSLGALTTNAIPPKVEAIHLIVPIPYTYEYNQTLIQSWNSSLIYNAFLGNYMTPITYLYVYIGLAAALLVLTYVKAVHEDK